MYLKICSLQIDITVLVLYDYGYCYYLLLLLTFIYKSQSAFPIHYLRIFLKLIKLFPLAKTNFLNRFNSGNLLDFSFRRKCKSECIRGFFHQLWLIKSPSLQILLTLPSREKSAFTIVFEMMKKLFRTSHYTTKVSFKAIQKAKESYTNHVAFFFQNFDPLPYFLINGYMVKV